MSDMGCSICVVHLQKTEQCKIYNDSCNELATDVGNQIDFHIHSKVRKEIPIHIT
jgi:hypothetical protein